MSVRYIKVKKKPITFTAIPVKARVKALFEKVPPNEIPKQVVRPEQLGHDEGIWNRELEAAQFTVGRFLVAALEGCDTGKDEKLGELEMTY